jgi:thioredoxin-like negative regulator of GroEL
MVELTPLSVVQYMGSRGDKITMVKFCIPNFQQCAEINAVWKQLEPDFGGKGGFLAEVDCSSEENLCRRHNVQQLPSIIMFKRGLQAWNIQGRENHASLKSFLQTATGQTVDYYAVLGLQKEASQQEVRKAYRHAARNTTFPRQLAHVLACLFAQEAELAVPP